MKKVKALIVDDSAFNRAAISKMLESDVGIEVVGTAHDGVDAIAKTLRLQPDVITLDLEMPNMDGFTFLRWLMKERPTPAIILTSRSDSRSVFRAMELGAVDFIPKPEVRISKSLETIRDELLVKVHAVLNLEMTKVQSTMELLSERKAPPEARKEDEITSGQGAVEVVAIAASTGGPPALQAILTALPPDFSASIVIAQHMPPGFTRSFAERLNKLAPVVVSEAVTGDVLRPGMALIAPGGYHLIVKRERQGLVAQVLPRSPADKYVPSADLLLASVAEACGPAALGVVLTGMGKDGTAGALEIKRRRGRCLAESEESAVIFGMPQEAIRAGAVERVLPLSRMAAEIEARCRAPRHA
ncbi:MAG TPA: chemotaxis response regulator protein-glutamate methylesterase [Nitrospiraceae bacterium]|nr:chemotaxis response regulator protein-glutamate methylesterase [Nitrospiraceae bacterium]